MSWDAALRNGMIQQYWWHSVNNWQSEMTRAQHEFGHISHFIMRTSKDIGFQYECRGVGMMSRGESRISSARAAQITSSFFLDYYASLASFFSTKVICFCPQTFWQELFWEPCLDNFWVDLRALGRQSAVNLERGEGQRGKRHIRTFTNSPETRLASSASKDTCSTSMVGAPWYPRWLVLMIIRRGSLNALLWLVLLQFHNVIVGVHTSHLISN